MMHRPSPLHVHAAACVALSLVAASRDAAAQPPSAELPRDSATAVRADLLRAARLRTLLVGAVPGTEVRLVAGARAFPRAIAFQAVEGDTLVLRAPRPRRVRVALADVESLEVQRGTEAGRGALIGGGIGGVLLGSFGVALVRGLCEGSNGCSGDVVPAFALGFATGGAGGALIGAGVGAMVPRWRRVFP